MGPGLQMPPPQPRECPFGAAARPPASAHSGPCAARGSIFPGDPGNPLGRPLLGLEALISERVSMAAGKEWALLPGTDSKALAGAPAAWRLSCPVPFQPSHAQGQAGVGVTLRPQPGAGLAHQSGVHAGLFQRTFTPLASLGLFSCPNCGPKGGMLGAGGVQRSHCSGLQSGDSPP